jgi:hypothetical protein
MKKSTKKTTKSPKRHEHPRVTRNGRHDAQGSALGRKSEIKARLGAIVYELVIELLAVQRARRAEAQPRTTARPRVSRRKQKPKAPHRAAVRARVPKKQKKPVPVSDPPICRARTSPAPIMPKIPASSSPLPDGQPELFGTGEIVPPPPPFARNFDGTPVVSAKTSPAPIVTPPASAPPPPPPPPPPPLPISSTASSTP